MSALSLAILGGLWTSSAWAFCGTYVGGVESTPSNRASQIAIARDGSATTLTLFNDFSGDLSEFGLVIPVPPDFDQGNLRLADSARLARLDQYSAPRMVAYDYWKADCYDTDYDPCISDAENNWEPVDESCSYDSDNAKECLAGLEQLECPADLETEDESFGFPSACDAVWDCG
jgi:hypothetical protein